MNHEDLALLMRKRPFEPFRLYMSDGVTYYDVRHPEQCIVSRRTVAIGVPSSTNGSVFERVDLLATIHISRVEPLPTASEAQAG